jgi:hypothetical protein
MTSEISMRASGAGPSLSFEVYVADLWDNVLMESNELDRLRLLKRRLDRAVANGRSLKWCLLLWSRFIRERDADRCVMCGSTRELEAHHIWRKTTYPKGRLEPGNGITLCTTCHAQPHAKFNGRPDLQQPLDAEGGDDQDMMAQMWAALRRDADRRGLNHEEFYFIRDEMLQFFVGVQGYEPLYWAVQRGEMTRLQMACEIWQVMPEAFYQNFYREFVRLNFDSD